ncbi:hypothetical protein [Isoalcanivorax beigongshangi]|uniref:Uncharacterized protein n=1 Tax=Isoalcanivorax beigongshangi TaxID=3238810 RepID=A0ABV4AEU3_9GAMM
MRPWVWVILAPLFFYPPLVAYFTGYCADTKVGFALAAVSLLGAPLVRPLWLLAWLLWAVVVYRGGWHGRPGGQKWMALAVLAAMVIGGVVLHQRGAAAHQPDQCPVFASSVAAEAP